MPCWCARHLVGDEPFAVLLPDDLVLAQNAAASSRWSRSSTRPAGNIVAVEEVPREHTNRYGVLDIAAR